MSTINLTNKYKRYVLLQRNSYLSSFQKKIRKLFGRYLFTNFFVNYFNPISKINNNINKDFDKEFNQMLFFLPKKLNNILDIGSGLGIINVYLNNFYNNTPEFTLIDKTQIEKKVSYGFDSKGQFYNNFDLTLDFLESHGIDIKKINLVNADLKNEINKNFDLVISLLSMGYHYPITQYLDILRFKTNKDTVFIFDIADEYINIENIKKLFGSVKIIHKSHEIRHNYLRICSKDLKN
jgi:hypothetical protein